MINEASLFQSPEALILKDINYIFFNRTPFSFYTGKKNPRKEPPPTVLSLRGFVRYKSTFTMTINPSPPPHPPTRLD